MNPFYNTRGFQSPDKAERLATRRAATHGKPFCVVLDTDDGDWHAFGASAVPRLWAPRYKVVKQIGEYTNAIK